MIEQPYGLLIVDDDEDILELLAFEVDSKGIRTFKASNVKEAVESVKKNKPDIILTDFHIGSHSTFKTMMEEILQLSLPSIPQVYIMTGKMNLPKDFPDSYNIMEVIIKPFNVDELLLRMSKNLEAIS